MHKKILVIRFSSIGDIVLTTPVLRLLHAEYGALVHFLTKSSFASVLSSNPNIDKIISFDGDFEKMIALLRHEEYDHIIDLHNNLRTKRITLALKKPTSAFHKLNFEKWLMVNFKINRLPDLHIVDRYMDTLAFLNLRNDHRGLDFFIPDDKQINVQALFDFSPGKYVSFVIGATYNTKCLTIDQLALLCDYINLPVILLGGKQEVEKANEIILKSKNINVRSACGMFDIVQSASILDQGGMILSHDTGLMHIAAALKKPQVVIWGNTIPEFGMYPYYGNHQIDWISFEQTDLNCRPCTKLGYDKCPKGHFKCILDHDMIKISSTILQLMHR